MPNINVDTINNINALGTDASAMINSIKSALVNQPDGGYWLSEINGSSVLISDAEIGTNFSKFNQFVQNHKASGAKDFVYVVKAKDSVKLLNFDVEDTLGINNEGSFDSVSLSSDMDDISINSILSDAIADLDSEPSLSRSNSNQSQSDPNELSHFLDDDDGYIFNLQNDDEGISITSVMAKYKIAELGSSLIGVARHIAAASLIDSSTAEGKANISSAAIATIGSASDAATSILKAGGISGNGVIALGSASGVLSAVSNFIHVGVVSANFKNLSYKEQIAAGVELGMKVAGSLGMATSAISSAVLGANQIASSLPGLGAAAATISLAVSPMTILSIMDQSDRAKAIAELGDVMKKADYEGDSILAGLLKDQLALDASHAGISMGLGVVGAAVSAASAASIVGAPVAAVVGLASGIILGILEATKQPILEAIAQKYKSQIDDLGGAEKLFNDGLASNFKIDLQAKEEFLKELQKTFSADYVVAAGGSKASDTMLELAAITKTTQKLQTATNLASMVKDGSILKSDDEKRLVIDSEKGSLQISNKTNDKVLVTFTTPLFAPGVEENIRSKKGKNDYYTKLVLKAPKDGYTIKGGDGDETFRLDDKYASVIIDQDSGNLKNLRLNIDGGKGDDKLIANAGFNNFDGGEGNDAAIYSGDNISKIWLHSNDDGSYVVSKAIKDANVAHEEINSKKVKYGKRTEKVEYRDLSIKKASYIATDELKNVEVVLGSKGDDEMKGGLKDDVFIGGEGDDKLYGGAGNDVLVGGDGDDKLYGGEGNDILIGGSGKNYLDGGLGNDVYIIESGDINLIKDSGGNDTIIINSVNSNFMVKAQGSKTMVVFEDGSFVMTSKNMKILASTSGEGIGQNSTDVTAYGFYAKTDDGISLSSADETMNMSFAGVNISSLDAQWLS